MLIAALASGHPGTVNINSLYVQLSFRYIWVMLHNNDVASLKHFNDHLYIVSYGDDNVHNKSAYASMIMTEERLIPLFKAIGLKYTNERKDGDQIFLSRQGKPQLALMIGQCQAPNGINM